MFLAYPLLLPKHTCKLHEKNSDLLMFQLLERFFFKSFTAFTDFVLKLTHMNSIDIMKYRFGRQRKTRPSDFLTLMI